MVRNRNHGGYDYWSHLVDCVGNAERQGLKQVPLSFQTKGDYDDSKQTMKGDCNDS